MYKIVFLAFLLMLGCVVENCKRSYYFSGTVTDSSNDPVPGVSVLVGSAEIAITDDDGKYSYSSIDTRYAYVGQSLNFLKEGYVQSTASAFTEAESGPDVCGDAVIVRDVSLQLE